jgi:hypothetical protein
VETLSVFSYQEAIAVRYGGAAAYSIILFIYVLLIAYVFVRVLGADLIGEAGPPKKKKKKQITAATSAEVSALEMMGGAH